MANETSSSAPGGIPGSGSGFDFKTMFDAMEQARRSWSSSFSLPEAMTPTVDPQELDKRIADLRTVEQWLSLNLSLVQGSVKALEMQRATLDAMRAFGQQASAAAPAADPMAAAASQAQEWWQGLQAQFRQVADAALAASQPPSQPSGRTAGSSAESGKPTRQAGARSSRTGAKR